MVLNYDGKIIGSVRAFEKGETCYIGRLIVHADYQNQGFGTKLLNRIENIFNSKRFELFTDIGVKRICIYIKSLVIKYSKVKKSPTA